MLGLVEWQTNSFEHLTCISNNNNTQEAAIVLLPLAIHALQITYFDNINFVSLLFCSFEHHKKE